MKINVAREAEVTESNWEGGRGSTEVRKGRYL